MNLNDYILESVSDVDVMDIQLAQLIAEMAVVNAMIDCIEKEETLLEYNAESAEEILMESALTFFMEGKKNISAGAMYVQIEGIGNKWVTMYNNVPQGIFPATENGKKKAGELAKKINDGEVKPITKLEMAVNKLGEDATTAYNEAKNIGDQIKTAGKEIKGAASGFHTGTKNAVDKMGKGTKTFGKGVADATNSATGFLSKLINIFTSLCATLVTTFFSIDFEKMAKDVKTFKGSKFDITSDEYVAINSIDKLLAIIDSFGTEVNNVSALSKKAEYKNLDKKLEGMRNTIVKFDKEQEEARKSLDESESGSKVQKMDIAAIFMTLGKGEVKKKMIDIKKSLGMWNLECDSVPEETAKSLRTTFKILNKRLTHLTTAMSKIYKRLKGEYKQESYDPSVDDSINKSYDMSHEATDVDFF